MTLPAACPKCKKQYRLPDQLAGKSVKCNACGNSFAVGAPSAAPAMATTAKTNQAAAGVSRNSELVKFGIDGPIVRTSTDIFADAPQPPRQGDALGNFAAEDPGFGDGTAAKSKKKNPAPAPPPKAHGGHGATEKPSALPFDNPHAAAAATFAKQPKVKASELQKEFDRLDKAASNLRSIMLGFLASILFPPAILGLLYLIIWFNDFAFNFSLVQWGLTPELYYTAIGMTAFAALIFLTTYFVFANGAVRLAGNLNPDSKSWLLHLVLCVTLIGGVISFIMLNLSGRDQLKKAGFNLGFLGVTRSPGSS
jgi:predicted Zn finger-like uncharacterized protein